MDNEIKKNEKIEAEKSLAYLIGVDAFKEILKASIEDKDPTTNKGLIDDPEIVFEYLYLETKTLHPTEAGVEVTLTESDRVDFIAGWEAEEERYQLELEAQIEKAYKSKDLYPKGGIFANHGFDMDDDDDDEGTENDWFYKGSKHPRGSAATYSRIYNYTEPKVIYDRFNKVETSKKKIIFPKELSELFWNVFQTASGKEIMFYGELNQSEENPDIFTVTGMNFPPQKNYGGYVETVDGTYENWIFNEIILKGKKIPLHVHTHPDFSAFSSSVDEKQIKQYIEDNAGNKFVVQLIVSNPRKGNYFIRWFDLENNTWERPSVEFTYEAYDVELHYPGIFQFNAPSRFPSLLNDDDKDGRKWFSQFRADAASDKEDEEDSDENFVDLSDPKEFDKYFKKKYKQLAKTK